MPLGLGICPAICPAQCKQKIFMTHYLVRMEESERAGGIWNLGIIAGSYPQVSRANGYKMELLY